MSFSGHRATFHRRGTLHVGWGELPYDHRRIFAEVKRRPLYVVAERVGDAADAAHPEVLRDDRRAVQP